MKVVVRVLACLLVCSSVSFAHAAGPIGKNTCKAALNFARTDAVQNAVCTFAALESARFDSWSGAKGAALVNTCTADRNDCLASLSKKLPRSCSSKMVTRFDKAFKECPATATALFKACLTQAEAAMASTSFPLQCSKADTLISNGYKDLLSDVPACIQLQQQCPKARENVIR